MKNSRLVVFLIPILFVAVIYFALTQNSKTELPAAEIFRELPYLEQLNLVKDAAKKNPVRTWNFIRSVLLVNGQQVSDGHEFSHVVGNAMYSKYGLDGIRNCDPSFSFGCYHGVTEKMLQEKGAIEVKEVQEKCISIFPPSQTHNYTNCIHGAGHGLYVLAAGNLGKALLECDRFDQPYRRFCYDGVFMENSSTPGKGVFDPKDPWKFCANLDEKYHRNCARYESQISLAGIGSVNLVDKAGEICLKGPTVLLRDTCFESIGFHVAQALQGDLEGIWDACAKMTGNDFVALCATSAAEEIVFQRYPDYQKSAVQLCDRLAEPNRPTCLNGVNNMMKN